MTFKTSHLGIGYRNIVCIWVRLMRLQFSVLLFFFFARVWETNTATVYALFMNSNRKSLTFFTFQHKFYCLWTHKFHFSITFSLKISSTVLFTHLKIILLQYFSIFSFNFQFSVSIFSCIQTDPIVEAFNSTYIIYLTIFGLHNCEIHIFERETMQMAYC